MIISAREKTPGCGNSRSRRSVKRQPWIGGRSCGSRRVLAGMQVMRTTGALAGTWAGSMSPKGTTSAAPCACRQWQACRECTGPSDVQVAMSPPWVVIADMPDTCASPSCASAMSPSPEYRARQHMTMNAMMGRQRCKREPWKGYRSLTGDACPHKFESAPHPNLWLFDNDTWTGSGREKHESPTSEVLAGLSFVQSGRRDSNPRPLEPHSSALPGCATSRTTAPSPKLPGTD